jgi:hypothetical protein
MPWGWEVGSHKLLGSTPTHTGCTCAAQTKPPYPTLFCPFLPAAAPQSILLPHLETIQLTQRAQCICLEAHELAAELANGFVYTAGIACRMAQARVEVSKQLTGYC